MASLYRGAFEEAFLLAHRLHGQQVRKKTGVPYITHLMAVAALVGEYGGDEQQVIAALLHDAVEDQGGAATREQIRRRFGSRVARIVDDCTDTDQQPKPPWLARKQAYLARLREEVADDSLIVVAADKLHNVRSIQLELERFGAPVFERFNGKRDGTLWYYRAVSDVLRSRRDDQLARDLCREVSRLHDLAGEAQPFGEGHV